MYTQGLPRWLSDKESNPMHETQETWFNSPAEDTLEEEMATSSSIPAWKIP